MNVLTDVDKSSYIKGVRMTFKPYGPALLGVRYKAYVMSARAGQLIPHSEANDPIQTSAKAALVKGIEVADPDARVKVNIFARESYRRSILRSSQSGDAADIVNTYSGTRLAALSQARLFEDMTDVLKQNGLNIKRSTTAASMTVNGKKRRPRELLPVGNAMISVQATP